MGGAAHFDAINFANHNCVASIGVRIVKVAKDVCLGIGEIRGGSTIQSPISIRKAILNISLPEGTRKVALFGPQDIDAETPGRNEGVVETGRAIDANKD